MRKTPKEMIEKIKERLDGKSNGSIEYKGEYINRFVFSITLYNNTQEFDLPEFETQLILKGIYIGVGLADTSPLASSEKPQS